MYIIIHSGWTLISIDIHEGKRENEKLLILSCYCCSFPYFTYSSTYSKTCLKGPLKMKTKQMFSRPIDSFHIVSAHAPNSLVPHYLGEITREGSTCIRLPYITQWKMEND